MPADASANAPLARFAAVDTRFPDEARDAIGRIFCPHFLTPAARSPDHFHARHHSTPQAGYSMNFVAYGAEVEIDPGELSGFFLLQVPVKGAARVRCGNRLTDAAAGHLASVLSPTLPTRMTWHDGCEKVIVLIRRQEVERLAGAMIDRPDERVEFETGIDLEGPVGRALARHVQIMLDAADGPAPVPEPYQVLLRDGLATLMLTGLRHDRAGLMARPPAPPGPVALRRAESFLIDHAAQPIAMADVARAAGTNLRSLQEAFRRHRGETLTERLQTIRLERLRETLIDAGDEARVTELIFQAGLGHAGRAAAAYAARYGEAPSQTRRRVR
ncbi:MAG: helix-turn-helix domain-containing protein [Phreatobacter sp.]